MTLFLNLVWQTTYSATFSKQELPITLKLRDLGQLTTLEGRTLSLVVTLWWWAVYGGLRGAVGFTFFNLQRSKIHTDRRFKA